MTCPPCSSSDSEIIFTGRWREVVYLGESFIPGEVTKGPNWYFQLLPKVGQILNLVIPLDTEQRHWAPPNQRPGCSPLILIWVGFLFSYKFELALITEHDLIKKGGSSYHLSSLYNNNTGLFLGLIQAWHIANYCSLNVRFVHCRKT